jgi:hypothetical protein
VSISETNLSKIGVTTSGRKLSPDSKLYNSKLLPSGVINYAVSANMSLYVANADGTETLVPGITGTVDSNGVGVIDGIKDGFAYVVKVDKPGTNGKSVNLETIVNVPTGATEVVGEATEKTVLIKQIVLDSMKAAGLGQDIPQSVIDLVVSTAVTTINSMLEKGLISLPDPVLDGTDEAKEAEDAALISTGDLDEDQARKIIASIFSDMIGDHIPLYELFESTLADSYVDGDMFTIDTIATAYRHSFRGNQSMRAFMSKSTIKKIIRAELSQIGDFIYKSENAEELANLPYFVQFVFPSSEEDKWTIDINNNSDFDSIELTIPQTLIVLLKSALAQGKGLDSLATDYPEEGFSNLNPEIMKDMWYGDLFFDQLMFLESMSLVTIEEDSVLFNNIRIESLKDWQWDQNTNSHTVLNLLRVEVNLHTGHEAPVISKATFTYTDKDGNTKTVDMTKDDWGNHFMIEPWHWEQEKQTRILDHATGTATIKILGEDNSVLATTTKDIFNFGIPRPEITSPTWGDNSGSISNNDEGFADLKVTWDIPTVEDLDSTKYKLKYSVRIEQIAEGMNGPAPNDLGDFPTESEVHSRQGGWDMDDGWRKREVLFDTEPAHMDPEFRHRENKDGAPDDDIDNTVKPNYITGTQFTLLSKGIELPKTQSNSEYRIQYSVRVVPVVVRISDDFVVDRGEMDERYFEVTEPVNWQLRLKGSVKVSSEFENMLRYLPKDENGDIVDGSLKIGLFKSHTWDNSTFTHKDYIWDFSEHTDGALMPLTVNGDLMVSELTSIENIATGDSLAFEMPQIDKSDDILQEGTGYRLIIFYDQDTVNDQNGTLTNAVEDGIDSSSTNYYFQEYMFDKGEIMVDPSGIMFFDDGYPKLITEDDLSDQNIELVWGWNSIFNDYDKTGTADSTTGGHNQGNF